jgi:hypothetical protein
MKTSRQRLLKSIELGTAIAADRLFVLALDPLKPGDLFGKLLTEAIALILALALLVLLEERVFSRPAIVFSWKGVGHQVPSEGPALQLPGDTSFVDLGVSMRRQGWLASWVLGNARELHFELNLEPPLAARLHVESAVPPCSTNVVTGDAIAGIIRCTRGGEANNARLSWNASGAPGGLREVTVSAHLRTSSGRQRRWVRLVSPVTVIRW